MPSTREIREALGLRSGASSRQVINAAIRNWMVGGDDLLDAMELVNRLAARLKERQLAGQNEAQAALNSLLRLRDLMEALVRERSTKT